LFYGSTTSAHLAKAASQLGEECIERVAAVIAARDPTLDPARRRLYALINVHVIKALLPLANSSDPVFRTLLLAEIKTLLLAHMKNALDRDAEASPPGPPKAG